MIIKNKVLTKRDVIMLNTQENSCVILNNTIGQDPGIIALISPNVHIQVLGGYNPKITPRFAEEKYAERTIYSPKVLAAAIRQMEKIESEINPDFTEMEKAFFVFQKLVETTQYDSQQIYKNHNRNLECLTHGFARCAGFSMCYKELLDRMHIKNEFKNVANIHSFNVLTINNKTFIADATWGRNAYDQKDDYTQYFGRLNVEENFFTHRVIDEPKPYYDMLTKEQVTQIARNVKSHKKIREFK